MTMDICRLETFSIFTKHTQVSHIQQKSWLFSLDTNSPITAMNKFLFTSSQLKTTSKYFRITSDNFGDVWATHTKTEDSLRK